MVEGIAQKKFVRLLFSSRNLSGILRSIQDYDPMAEHRVPRIADREDEYRQKKLSRIISPARHDPFADGKSNSSLFSATFLAVHL